MNKWKAPNYSEIAEMDKVLNPLYSRLNKINKELSKACKEREELKCQIDEEALKGLPNDPLDPQGPEPVAEISETDKIMVQDLEENTTSVLYIHEDKTTTLYVSQYSEPKKFKTPKEFLHWYSTVKRGQQDED